MGKNHSRGFIVLTVVAALACCMLAACSSGQASSSSSASSASTSASSSLPATSTGVSSPVDGIPSDSVLLFTNDAGIAKLVSDMGEGHIPTSCNVLYDMGGSRPDVDVTDPATIKQIYDALAQVTVNGPSNMSVTDSYHHVIFTLESGAKVGLSFEGDGLLVGGKTNFDVSNTRALWKIVKDLQDQSMGE